MNGVIEQAPKRLRFTASQNVSGASGLCGILVSSSAAGVITVADDNGLIANAMGVVGGQFYAMPVVTVGAVVITVTGTLDATLFYA